MGYYLSPLTGLGTTELDFQRKALTVLIFKLAMVLLCVGFTVAFPILLIRLIAGFYRSNDRGGGISSGLAGGLVEIDRITRPSIQYVEQVKEHRVEEESIGGE